MAMLRRTFVVRQQVQRSPLKPLGKSKLNFMWNSLKKGKRIFINGSGHMTKTAAMAVNNKTLKKNLLLLQNQKVFDFETWHGALQN